MIRFKGKKKKLSEWAREAGISRQLLHDRLERGYTMEEAMDPAKYGGQQCRHCFEKGHRTAACPNVKGSVAQLASQAGVSYVKVRTRLAYGWSLKEALSKKRVHHCSVCKKTGHNKTTCGNS